MLHARITLSIIRSLQERQSVAAGSHEHSWWLFMLSLLRSRRAAAQNPTNCVGGIWDGSATAEM